MTFVGVFLIGNLLFSQGFQSTFSRLGLDFNHYSIESTPFGYACAGTLFDPATANNDIHVFMVDAYGLMIWEKVIDESADDRALDIVFDGGEALAITGYISPNGVGSGQMYVAMFDVYGNFVTDRAIDNFSSSAGTNIIFSSSQQEFVVGGLYADSFNGSTVVDNEALLITFDLALNPIADVELSTTDLAHSTINDIVEVPNQGYFVTGGLGVPFAFATSYSDQVVLAAMLDYSLSITTDLSFENTNSYQLGVSAVYDNNSDEIYLLSNNSISHNPEITIIANVSFGPTVTGQYRLDLDPTYGAHNAGGFQLQECLWEPNHLVVSGYFQNQSDGVTSDNSIPWITEIDKATGTMQSAYIWPVSSPNFSAHGGGLFSTVNGVQSYLFNQEILAPRIDGQGYVFISPHSIGGDFGIDLVTTFYNHPMNCGLQYPFNTVVTSGVAVNQMVANNLGFSDYQPLTVPSSSTSNYTVHCKQFRSISTDKDTEAEINIYQDLNDITMAVTPNPANDHFSILLSGENISGTVKVLNSLGQIVYESAAIDGNRYVNEIQADGLKAGLYLVVYTTTEGASKTVKIIKE